MTPDGLVTQGAKASAAMPLTCLSRNIAFQQHKD